MARELAQEQKCLCRMRGHNVEVIQGGMLHLVLRRTLDICVYHVLDPPGRAGYVDLADLGQITANSIDPT